AVAPAVSEQLGLGAPLHHGTVLQPQDLVGARDGAEPVGDDEGGEGWPWSGSRRGSTRYRSPRRARDAAHEIPCADFALAPRLAAEPRAQPWPRPTCRLFAFPGGDIVAPPRVDCREPDGRADDADRGSGGRRIPRPRSH